MQGLFKVFNGFIYRKYNMGFNICLWFQCNYIKKQLKNKMQHDIPIILHVHKDRDILCYAAKNR